MSSDAKVPRALAAWVLLLLLFGTIAGAGAAHAQTVPNPTCASDRPVPVTGVAECPTTTTTTEPPGSSTPREPNSKPPPASSTPSESNSEPPPAESEPVFTAPTGSGSTLPVPAGSTPSFDAPSIPVPSAPTAGVAARRVSLASLQSNPGFAYPVVFLLPLVLVAVAAWLGWAFTADLRTALRPADSSG